ncbi:MAG: hypothetical protein ACI3V3_02495 [Faecousia sp.]
MSAGTSLGWIGVGNMGGPVVQSKAGDGLTIQMYNSLMAMGLRQKDNTSILPVNEALNRLDHGETKNKEATPWT